VQDFCPDTKDVACVSDRHMSCLTSIIMDWLQMKMSACNIFRGKIIVIYAVILTIFKNRPKLKYHNVPVYIIIVQRLQEVTSVVKCIGEIVIICQTAKLQISMLAVWCTII